MFWSISLGYKSCAQKWSQNGYLLRAFRRTKLAKLSKKILVDGSEKIRSKILLKNVLRGTTIVLRGTGSQTKYSEGLNLTKGRWGNTCNKSLVTLIFIAELLNLVLLRKKSKHSISSGFPKGNRFMISWRVTMTGSSLFLLKTTFCIGTMISQRTRRKELERIWKRINSLGSTI